MLLARCVREKLDEGNYTVTGNVLDRLGGDRLLYKFAHPEANKRIVVGKKEAEEGAVINIPGQNPPARVKLEE